MLTSAQRSFRHALILTRCRRGPRRSAATPSPSMPGWSAPPGSEAELKVDDQPRGPGLARRAQPAGGERRPARPDGPHQAAEGARGRAEDAGQRPGGEAPARGAARRHQLFAGEQQPGGHAERAERLSDAQMASRTPSATSPACRASWRPRTSARPGATWCGSSRRRREGQKRKPLVVFVEAKKAVVELSLPAAEAAPFAAGVTVRSPTPATLRAPSAARSRRHPGGRDGRAAHPAARAAVLALDATASRPALRGALIRSGPP